MPRFAILEHDFPTRHWDLLLEDGPDCRTWRLPAGLLEQGAEENGNFGCKGLRRSALGVRGENAFRRSGAEALPNHRLMYLDYEGPVSGNRGMVARWDGGTFVWITALADRVSVLLRGTRWTGRLDLICQNEAWRVAMTPAETQQAGKPRPAV